MEKSAKREGYSSLERALGERRKDIPYHSLKTGIIESFVVGRIACPRSDMHSVMAEMLGLDKETEGQLKNLFSEVLLPLQTTLDATKIVIFEAHMIKNILPPEERKVIESETRPERDRLRETLSDMVIKSVLNPLESFFNVKAVVVYPLLIATINSWRQFDFDFADKLIRSIKANEPDPKLKMIVEQLDIPVTVEQLRRN